MFVTRPTAVIAVCVNATAREGFAVVPAPGSNTTFRVHSTRPHQCTSALYVYESAYNEIEKLLGSITVISALL